MYTGKMPPDATDVIAEDFNFGKDCRAYNEQRQGKIGVQLCYQTILPADVVLVHIDLKEYLCCQMIKRGEVLNQMVTGPLKSPAERVSRIPAIDPG